jgi:hypothetical protein
LVVGAKFPYPSPDVSFHNIGVIYLSSLGNHASASHVSRDRVRWGASLWVDIMEGKVMPDYYQCFQCGQKYKSAIYCPRCGVMNVEKYLKPNEQLVNVPPPPLPGKPAVIQQPTKTIYYHAEPVQRTTPVDVMATEVISELRWQRFWRGLGCWVAVISAFLCTAATYFLWGAIVNGFNYFSK